MKGRRLLVLSAIAFAFGCEDRQNPTGPSVPINPSKMISDGAHGGNPDFFFLPPMVSNPVNNPNFEPGKFNATLQPSLRVEICELQGAPVDAQGLPVATDCVAGQPVKIFPAGTVRLQGGTPEGFYQVLWHTRESNLDVTKFYRIKVMIEGLDIPFGVADIDPVSNMKEFKNARTGEVIPLNDDSTLPIKFRIEKGGGPTLCGNGSLCASATVTNHTANGDPQVVPVQGNNGPLAGAVFPDGWLPPGGPQTVVVTISSVNTGVNDVSTGTQSNPCHVGLPLEQFNGCFRFTTTPALAPLAEGEHQFARAVTVVTCYVLHDTGDPREKFAQLWSSGPEEPAHPLVSVSDALVLTVDSEHNCGSNFQTVIGSNGAGSSALRELASSGWRKLKGMFGVKTAYAVDLGLGGLTLDFSNVSPVLTAQIQRYTGTGLTLAAGATTTSTARIVGTQKHNGGALTTGIGGLPVTFTVAPGNGTLRLIGSEAPPAVQLTSITNTNPIDSTSPVSGGGFAPVNWTMPSVPGTYTLTATGPATGGPVTFTATVRAAGKPLYVVNTSGNSITVYAAGASGNATPTATIAGGNTGLCVPIGIALDGAGNIYAANACGSITVYAAGASGNATPTATIAGGNTGLNVPYGIALDGAGNIYVTNAGGQSITVYAAGATGNATPTATIAGGNTGLFFPIGIALDGSGNIYVANNDGGSQHVTVYAAGASGNATPMATIAGGNTGLQGPIAIALDGAGNIYVANGGGSDVAGSITVYAAGASGNATPTARIAGSNTGLTLPSANSFLGIALDGTGKIYVATGNSITVFAAGASGNATPTATIAGGNTGLNRPALITF